MPVDWFPLTLSLRVAALSTALERDLVELAMPSCRVDVRLRPIDDAAQWTRRGTDNVEFFFSPNMR